VRIVRLIAPTLALVLLAATPAAAQTARTPALDARIVNGHAPTQAWPAQTSVRFTTASGTFVCGGTLVSARWVLTAGHCATDDAGAPLAPGAFALRVGSTSRTSGGFTTTVDTVARNPGYSQTGAPANDLALLHLAAAAPQEPMTLIAASGADAALWGPGAQATIVGWGVTETGNQSATLLEAQVPMISDLACANVWGPDFNAASMVCAGGASTDTCGGDSGGPLMVPRAGAFAIAGVTSWGSNPCGQAGTPGVYARLGATALNAWVRDRVPTAAIAVSPAAPVTGEQVTLSATVAPGSQVTTPALAWDLDGDGAFDDATGASATTAFATAGTHAVRVQASFADGDRAVARELVAVAAAGTTTPATPATPATDPPADTTAPVTTTPAAQPATPAPQQQTTVAQPSASGPLGSVDVPARLRLRTLRVTGVRVTLRCAHACTASGRLTIDAATARRLGLASGGGGRVTIGRGSGALATAASGRMTVRLTARARRALRNRSRITVRLATTLRSGAARLDATRAIAVSR
jgi:secreted trypsin-like serine protease